MVVSARDSLVQAGNIFKAEIRISAQQAAGADRKLSRHRSQSVLAADWEVKRYASGVYQGYSKPRGPWGIRDNSFVGGRTKPHEIKPKKAQRLYFYDQRKGRWTMRKRVWHPGSKRDNYWEQGASRAQVRIVRSISSELIGTVRYAFDNPWKARKGA
jgi:hypothetical protein